MPASTDRQYRAAVLPFAALMILNSAVITVLSALSALPITYCPFVADPQIQRAVVAGFALLQLVFGVGLALKSRTAWYGFAVYVAFGTIFMLIGLTFDPPGKSGGSETAVVALLAVFVSALIAIYLYLVRSVFK